MDPSHQDHQQNTRHYNSSHRPASLPQSWIPGNENPDEWAKKNLAAPPPPPTAKGGVGGMSGGMGMGGGAPPGLPAGGAPGGGPGGEDGGSFGGSVPQTPTSSVGAAGGYNARR